MKASLIACVVVAGAVCWIAGADGQTPAQKPASPPPSSNLPGDEPVLGKPMKPLTLAPRALRKQTIIPTAPKVGEEPSAPTRIAPKQTEETAPPTPGVKPPAPKPMPDKADAEDDEPIPGTASVRRARRDAPRPMASESASMDPTRKVEQAVSLEWNGPAHIKIRQPFACDLVVRNNGMEPAMNVVVHCPTPEGFKMTSAEPQPTPSGDAMMWNVGALGPKQERRIRMEMIADRRGDLAFKAAVTASTPSSTRMKVTEPQLVVKQECPDKVMMGDGVPVAITVSNPGDGPTDNVIVHAKMSDGLKGDKGQEMINEVGVLAPGESRVLKLICHSIKGGRQTLTTIANADGGLKSDAETVVLVSEPKMNVAMTGPKLRYLDRAATYTVVVTNPGDAAANEVRVNVAVPQGFKPGSPPAGGKYDAATRTMLWTLGTINPGEKREVSYKCSAAMIGEHKHLASAEGARGLKGSADVVTKVEGIASLLMELADVDDPIEVGAETAYEVRITNHGSAPAMNVEIRALIPKEMSIKACQGPTEYKIEGQEVLYAPIPKLAPKADAVYRISVKANAVADVRFRARLASDSLSEPVIGEEGTKVYSDGKN